MYYFERNQLNFSEILNKNSEAIWLCEFFLIR